MSSKSPCFCVGEPAACVYVCLLARSMALHRDGAAASSRLLLWPPGQVLLGTLARDGVDVADANLLAVSCVILRSDKEKQPAVPAWLLGGASSFSNVFHLEDASVFELVVIYV